MLLPDIVPKAQIFSHFVGVVHRSNGSKGSNGNAMNRLPDLLNQVVANSDVDFPQ
jgi:hypothetical protein